MKKTIWCVGCSFTEGIEENQFTGWPLGLQERTRSTVVNLGLGGSGIEYHSWCVDQILQVRRPRDIIICCMTDRGRFTTWDNWDITTRDQEPPVDCITYSSGSARIRKLYYGHVRDEHMRWQHKINSQFILEHSDFVFKHHNMSSKSTPLPCYQSALSDAEWRRSCIDEGNHLSAEAHRLEGHWVWDQLVASGVAV